MLTANEKSSAIVSARQALDLSRCAIDTRTNQAKLRSLDIASSYV